MRRPNPVWNATTGSPIYTFGPIAGPAALDNQANVFFRLIDKSTVSSSGGTVAAAGTDRIDNVIISGTEVLTCSTRAARRTGRSRRTAVVARNDSQTSRKCAGGPRGNARAGFFTASRSSALKMTSHGESGAAAARGDGGEFRRGKAHASSVYLRRPRLLRPRAPASKTGSTSRSE